MMPAHRYALLGLAFFFVGCLHAGDKKAPVTADVATVEAVKADVEPDRGGLSREKTAVAGSKPAAAGEEERSTVTGAERSQTGEIEDVYLDDDLDFLDEDYETEIYTASDPLAPWNRMMFNFNDKLYFWFLKPVSSGYVQVVPSPVRLGIANFFENLSAPVRMSSSLLQGKGTQAQAEFARFLFNSTFGFFGFGSPADAYPHLSEKDEDMGQALGSYGVSEGFYIVWPFLGPSTLRDTVGTVGDAVVNPVSYLPLGASMGLAGEKKLNEASYRIGDYETLKGAAIDPYEAVRDAYLQHRQTKIED